MEENNDRSLYENLEYLNETKGIIKQAIIDKGVEIDNNTPFREYADKIAEISESENLDNVITAQENKLEALETLLEGKISGSSKPNIFVQTTEPTKKKGIWLQTNKTTEHYISDADVYTGGEWAPSYETSNIPFAFVYGSSAKIGNVIYLFGGNSATTTAYKYNTLTDTYTRLANMPYGFYDSGGVAAVGTDIYIFGGEGKRNRCL